MKSLSKRLTGIPLWRAEPKVLSLFWSIPGAGKKISIFFEANWGETALR